MSGLVAALEPRLLAFFEAVWVLPLGAWCAEADALQDGRSRAQHSQHFSQAPALCSCPRTCSSASNICSLTPIAPATARNPRDGQPRTPLRAARQRADNDRASDHDHAESEHRPIQMFAKMVSVFGRFSFLDAPIFVTYRPGITTAASSVHSSGPLKTALDK